MKKRLSHLMVKHRKNGVLKEETIEFLVKDLGNQ